MGLEERKMLGHIYLPYNGVRIGYFATVLAQWKTVMFVQVLYIIQLQFSACIISITLAIMLYYFYHFKNIYGTIELLPNKMVLILPIITRYGKAENFSRTWLADQLTREKFILGCNFILPYLFLYKVSCENKRLFGKILVRFLPVLCPT